VGDVDEEGDSDPTPGAGPIGWAPLSAQAVVTAANVATIAIRRFMGFLLRFGTGPMVGVVRNRGTPCASRFGNSSIGGKSEGEPRAGAGLAHELDVATQ
jgi:hypothetical protein